MSTASRWLVCLAMLSAGALAARADAETLIVPGPHDDYNAVPFVSGIGRYQFVYGAALFPGARRIHEIASRRRAPSQ